MVKTMKTYTDNELSAALLKLVKASRYRTVAAAMGEDFGRLHRMAHGKALISKRVAAAMGFVPVVESRRWSKTSK